MNLEDVKTLIGNASKVCGSDGKLATSMGVSRTLVSDWRHGRKRCAPEDVAIIASIAGLDANAWAMRAMVWRWEGTPKGDRLMRALGKGFLATGAAIGSAGASAQAIFSSSQSVVDLIRCIERLNRFRHFLSFMLSKKAPIQGPFSWAKCFQRPSIT